MEREIDDLMSFRKDAECLNIPMFKEFKNVPNDNPQAIVVAKNDGGIIVQLTSDGRMMEGETFDERVDAVVKTTKEFMAQQNFKADDTTYFYYKDFKNDVFKYKLYVQDIIIPNANKVIRTFIAFFVEPKNNAFYQVSLSVGPFKMPTEHLKLGKLDLENDTLSQQMVKMFENYLTNLKYK